MKAIFAFMLVVMMAVTTVSFAQDKIAQLETWKLVARSYDGTLQRAVERYDLNTPLVVNPPRDSKGYSIVVLKYDDDMNYAEAFKLLFPRHKMPSDARASLMNNALAVEGHTIYVGEVYLAQLIIAAYNDVLALVQTGMETDQGTNYYEHLLRKNYAITSVMRFDNLQLLNQYSAADGKALVREAAVVAMARAIVATADEAAADNPIHAALSGVLAPLITHELAHLEEGIDIAGFFEFIERWKREKTRSSEDDADARAAAVTAKYLERLRQKDDEEFTAALRGVGSFVDVMKDQLLVEVTTRNADGRFHNLRASDLFVELLHANCTDDPSMADLSPLHPNRVLSGRLKSIQDMALFTKEDLQQLKRELVDRPNDLGHSHNFRRARLLLDIIKQFNSDFIQDDLKTFEILEGAVSRSDRAYAGQKLSSFPIPATRLEADLASVYKFEDAAWCPSEICRIGVPKDGSELGGFVEIVGDQSATYRLTWYAPIGLGSNDEYPKQMVQMTSFFLTVTGLLGPMLTASETVRANRIQCQVGAGLWEDDEKPYFIGMWSLFRPEWIAVQMQSKAALEEP